MRTTEGVVSVCMCVRVRVRAYGCVRACMGACVHAWVRACVYVCVCVCAYIHIHTYKYTNIYIGNTRPSTASLSKISPNNFGSLRRLTKVQIPWVTFTQGPLLLGPEGYFGRCIHSVLLCTEILSTARWTAGRLLYRVAVLTCSVLFNHVKWQHANRRTLELLTTVGCWTLLSHCGF